MPSNRNRRSVNHARDPEVVRGTPRPLPIGRGSIWAPSPGIDWASESSAASGVYNNPGNSRGGQHTRNPEEHGRHWRWRVWTIFFSTAGVIAGTVTVIEALRR